MTIVVIGENKIKYIVNYRVDYQDLVLKCSNQICFVAYWLLEWGEENSIKSNQQYYTSDNIGTIDGRTKLKLYCTTPDLKYILLRYVYIPYPMNIWPPKRIEYSVFRERENPNWTQTLELVQRLGFQLDLCHKEEVLSPDRPKKEEIQEKPWCMVLVLSNIFSIFSFHGWAVR